MDDVVGIDPETRLVRCSNSVLSYDYLIVAAGAGQSYFGHDEWADYAPSLKTVEDALEIRQRLLSVFETAEKECRSIPPTFVVVGGGATGVELAGHIAELAHQTLRSDFRNVVPTDARVLLIEAGDRILGGMSIPASREAHRQLERLGVDVITSLGVAHVDAHQVRLTNGLIVDAHFVAWAAGVPASPLGKLLGCELDRGERVRVPPGLSVPGHPDIFVIGDMAACLQPNGLHPVPGVAPTAKQSKHVAC